MVQRHKRDDQGRRLRFGLVATVTVGLMLALIGLFNWSWLWSYLIGINVATFLLYGYDKRAAGGGGLRVPERVLHGAELLGGTPAGFAGQRVFAHKESLRAPLCPW
ncbi:MAG: DUF1294 domain-containing protein [Caldilinea sp.]|nr:DUF1294 domain-containing protein [Caldilinea sp.]